MSGRMMKRASGLGVLTLVAGLASGERASAGYLAMGSTTGPAVNVNFRGADLSARGGSFAATLDGAALPFLYCVELDRFISIPATYDAEVRSDGVVHGGPIANAGAVAWLVGRFGATATTADQQGALQSAIWRTIYVADFKLLGADAAGSNAAGVLSYYTDYLAALGTNVDPVANVRWLSPRGVDNLGARFQGQVTAVPEPSAIALAGLGGLGLLAVRRRSARRRSPA